jgi:hypothetical protein
MNISYELYQAGRVKTTREQREEDVRAGELAAAFGQLWHSLAHPRGGGRRGFRATAGAGQARAACGSSTGPHAICG